MDPALLVLTRMKMRARLRRLLRGLRTVKGIAYAVIVLGFASISFGPAIVTGVLRKAPVNLQTQSLSSVAILGICLLQLIGAKPESGVPFLPAEVDFLFPGPFTRRQLLAYKLSGLMLGALGVSLMFSIYLLIVVQFWLAGFIGIFLTFVFLQLVQLNVALLAGTVAERAFTLGRKLVLGGLGVALAAGVAFLLSQHGPEGVIPLLKRLRESGIGAVVLAPFEVFGRTISAPSLPALFGWGAIAAAIDAGLVLLMFSLDADFMETSVAASQKLYERMQNARRGNIWTASAKGTPRIRIPQLPWLGGAGPIVWRQLGTAIRGSRGMLIAISIFAISAGTPMLFLRRQPQAGGFIMLYGIGMLTIFLLPQMLRFDFRGDIDRMENLKTLPIRSLAIAVGELMVPVCLSTLLQVLLVAVVSAFLRSIPERGEIVLAFALPANTLVFAVENLIFLIFPYRLAPGGGTLDIQATGRQMLIMLSKMMILLIAAGASTGIGAGIYFLTNSLAGSLIAAWVMAATIAIGLLPIVAWAYVRFDPSVDTPP